MINAIFALINGQENPFVEGQIPPVDGAVFTNLLRRAIDVAGDGGAASQVQAGPETPETERPDESPEVALTTHEEKQGVAIARPAKTPILTSGQPVAERIAKQDGHPPAGDSHILPETKESSLSIGSRTLVEDDLLELNVAKLVDEESDVSDNSTVPGGGQASDEIASQRQDGHLNRYALKIDGVDSELDDTLLGLAVAEVLGQRAEGAPPLRIVTDSKTATIRIVRSDTVEGDPDTAQNRPALSSEPDEVSHQARPNASFGVAHEHLGNSNASDKTAPRETRDVGSRTHTDSRRDGTVDAVRPIVASEPTSHLRAPEQVLTNTNGIADINAAVAATSTDGIADLGTTRAATNTNGVVDANATSAVANTNAVADRNTTGAASTNPTADSKTVVDAGPVVTAVELAPLGETMPAAPLSPTTSTVVHGDVTGRPTEATTNTNASIVGVAQLPTTVADAKPTQVAAAVRGDPSRQSAVDGASVLGGMAVQESFEVPTPSFAPASPFQSEDASGDSRPPADAKTGSSDTSPTVFGSTSGDLAEHELPKQYKSAHRGFGLLQSEQVDRQLAGDTRVVSNPPTEPFAVPLEPLKDGAVHTSNQPTFARPMPGQSDAFDAATYTQSLLHAVEAEETSSEPTSQHSFTKAQVETASKQGDEASRRDQKESPGLQQTSPELRQTSKLPTEVFTAESTVVERPEGRTIQTDLPLSVEAPVSPSVGTGKSVGSVGDGSLQASQVDRVLESEQPRRGDTASIRIEDADGNSTFVRVTVRGDQVRTNIVHPDHHKAGQLAAGSDQLRDALNARGFQDATVNIQSPKGPADTSSAFQQPGEQSHGESREGRDGRSLDREDRQERREDARGSKQERQQSDQRRRSRRDREQ